MTLVYLIYLPSLKLWNLVTVLTPPSSTSDTDLIYTHVDSTPCFEINVRVPEKDMQDKNIYSNWTFCTGRITEGL